MKVYITKYALTQGIFEIDAERCTNTNTDMIEGIGEYKYSYFHGEGKEWHLTKEGAISQATKMRDARIKSLQKQIEKLTKMKFE